MKFVLLFLVFLLPIAVGAFSFNPPTIAGWEQEGEMEIFNTDNLYNHIDGASEFYFSYNFRQLWVVRYKKGEAEITLEVYDHGDPVHAWGIYSMERPSGAAVQPIGAEGYYEESILNFVTGRYYVKLNSFREPDAGKGVLLTTAKDLAPKLEENPDLPTVVKLMPKQNLVPNSCQYVSNTYMGYEFLGSAFRATYKTDQGELTLFVMEKQSPEEAAAILKKYHELLKTDPGELREGDYVLADPFNGTVHLCWKGKYLIGFSGDDLPGLRQSLLMEMKNKLD